MSGSSFLEGNLVELGSQGIVVAVLFMVKKSVICVNREFALVFGSVIVRLHLVQVSSWAVPLDCTATDEKQFERQGI